MGAACSGLETEDRTDAEQEELDQARTALVLDCI
jgi:hypothetical protein